MNGKAVILNQEVSVFFKQVFLIAEVFAVIVLPAVFNYSKSLVKMKLARFVVRIKSIPVPETIGYTGAVLYFQKCYSAADCMNCSGRHIKKVAPADLIKIEKGGYILTLVYCICESRFIDIILESKIKSRIRSCIKYQPALILAE